jgi:hypothetical protein
VDVSEALKLLSGGKAFQSPLVRRYAVDVLRNASDDELLLLLLQLVQALRYEPSEGGPASVGDGEVDVEDDDVLLLSAEDVEGARADDGGEAKSGVERSSSSKGVGDVASLSPLGAFLVERACASTAGEHLFVFDNMWCSLYLMTSYDMLIVCVLQWPISSTGISRWRQKTASRETCSRMSSTYSWQS